MVEPPIIRYGQEHRKLIGNDKLWNTVLQSISQEQKILVQQGETLNHFFLAV